MPVVVRSHHPLALAEVLAASRTAPGAGVMPGQVPLVDAVLSRLPRRGRVLLAVDGVGASGKTTLAAELCARADRTVLLLHADDFFHEPAVRHARGPSSPEGFWLDTYDTAALVATALRPLREGAPAILTSCYDRATRRAVDPDSLPVPPDVLVIVEGTFLHRAELRGFWDRSVFLDVDLAVAAERMQLRDGPVAAQLLQRYYGAQLLYFADSRPWERASLVVDAVGRHAVAPEHSAAALVSAALGVGPLPTDWPVGDRGAPA